MRILLTGGMGYIGSHVCVELMKSGHDVAIYDNLSNSSPSTLELICGVAGRNAAFTHGDVRDRAAVVQALREVDAQAVIHLAGCKIVEDSIAAPLDYYETNVAGTLKVLEAMAECNVKTFVFSSTANVYGAPSQLPVNETHRILPTNPYGRSKRMVEEILGDLHKSDSRWRIAILRYFNPVGSHQSGLLGEDPVCAPSNLFPKVLQVAQGRRAQLDIWGGDYETADGTGVRDYIHVEDLADGHAKALNWLTDNPGCEVFNLGSGTGFSVMEVIKAFAQACRHPVPYRIGPRRAGDVAASFADISKAGATLGWRPRHTLESICASVWHWQNTVDKNQNESTQP